MKVKSTIWLTLLAWVSLSLISVLLLLPYLFDFYIFPQLQHKLPFQVAEFSISRFSPWKIRGTLSLGENDQKTSIPRFEISYSPLELFSGKINELLVDGAIIHLNRGEASTTLPGMDFQSTTEQTENPLGKKLLPLALEKLILRNCSITVHTANSDQENLLLNSEFQLNYREVSKRQFSIEHVSGTANLSGSLSAEFSIEFNAAPKGFALKTTAQLKDIRNIERFVPELQKIKPTGALLFEAKARLTRHLRLADFELSANLKDYSCTINGISLHYNNNDLPVTLYAQGDLNNVTFDIDNLGFSGPMQGKLHITGGIQPEKGLLNSQTDIFFNEPVAHSTLILNGNWKQSSTSLVYSFKSDSFSFKDLFSVSSIDAMGQIDITPDHTQGTLRANTEEITYQKSPVSLQDIEMFLPFQLPPSNPALTQAGYLKVADILYNDSSMGQLLTAFKQSDNGLSFEADLSNVLNGSGSIHCQGGVDGSRNTKLDCSLPKIPIDSSALGSLVEIPSDLSFSANIEGTAHLTIKNGLPIGNASLKLDDGELTAGENNVSNISLDLSFPKLPSLNSLPTQPATASEINIGNIALQDARFSYRIEEDQSLFIEQAKVNWCGGRLETAGLRIHQDMDSFSTTLYADRLNFSQLLSQFGITDTEGDGSLNGKLPIEIRSDGITFDDGFLFSTPGQKGVIKFNDTSQLREAIPGIEETGYLDYSMQALENFSYNWTKLSFSNEGNDLRIAMQLDGKPAIPLPFGYKNGNIIQTTKGPGLQHPIRLDVNFRLPVQEMFQYGKNIQSLMENM